MRQKLDWRKVKRHRSYTVKQLAALYGVHVNTVRSWIRNEGLPTLGDGHEVLMHWSAIRDWIIARNESRKWTPTNPDEMPCLTCKAHKPIKAGTFTVAMGNTRKVTLHGECVGCGRSIQRFDVRGNLDAIRQAFGAEDLQSIRATKAPIGDDPAPVKDSLSKGEKHDASEPSK